MGFIFKPVRWVLGQIIIFIDWLTRPKPMQRSAEAQAEVDKQTQSMALYHFQMCPFCVKTRRQIRRLGLSMDIRDARYDPKWNKELIDEGGKYQVPCLKITKDDGSVQWMYESSEINQYLEDAFSGSESKAS